MKKETDKIESLYKIIKNEKCEFPDCLEEKIRLFEMVSRFNQHDFNKKYYFNQKDELVMIRHYK